MKYTRKQLQSMPVARQKETVMKNFHQYTSPGGQILHGYMRRFTDMMEASGNNVALVMSYSGHKSLESFKIYLHAPEQGCILTDQRIASVGLFVASFSGMSGMAGMAGTNSEVVNSLEIQQVAV